MESLTKKLMTFGPWVGIDHRASTYKDHLIRFGQRADLWTARKGTTVPIPSGETRIL